MKRYVPLRSYIIFKGVVGDSMTLPRMSLLRLVITPNERGHRIKCERGTMNPPQHRIDNLNEETILRTPKTPCHKTSISILICYTNNNSTMN